MNRLELEERLIDFSVLSIEIAGKLNTSNPGRHLSNQLIRSGTSVSLNYAEAQSGESRKDFLHKMKIVLKELRETSVCLKIIKRARLHQSDKRLQEAATECDELISIFVKSITTAQKNMLRL